MMMTTKISIWYDSTSENHGWIVSEDDETGTQTLAVCDDESEALRRGTEFAVARHLPLVECDQHGHETLLLEDTEDG